MCNSVYSQTRYDYQVMENDWYVSEILSSYSQMYKQTYIHACYVFQYGRVYGLVNEW